MFNMDFTQRVVVESAKMDWEPSPNTEEEILIFVKTGHLLNE